VVQREDFMQPRATVERLRGAQAPVVEVARDHHRGAFGQRVEQVAEQLELTLAVRLAQPQVHADGMQFVARHLQHAV